AQPSRAAARRPRRLRRLPRHPGGVRPDRVHLDARGHGRDRLDPRGDRLHRRRDGGARADRGARGARAAAARGREGGDAAGV
ncbi:MAG: hypothetical protein AVDCRST_MAG11-2421, partial [uncultured Gemmatimonadaceae bacterium]